MKTSQNFLVLNHGLLNGLLNMYLEGHGCGSAPMYAVCNAPGTLLKNRKPVRIIAYSVPVTGYPVTGYPAGFRPDMKTFLPDLSGSGRIWKTISGPSLVSHKSGLNWFRIIMRDQPMVILLGSSAAYRKCKLQWGHMGRMWRPVSTVSHSRTDSDAEMTPVFYWG